MKHSLKKKIFRISILVLLGIIQANCDGHKSESIQKDEQDHTFEGFENFPITQYYSLQLGQEIKSAVRILAESGFKKMEENESMYFWRESDSTEVILPSDLMISEFKIFINSGRILNKKRDFMSFLEEKALKIDKNEIFSAMIFSLENSSFKMTVFEQSDFLRLNFEIE